LQSELNKERLNQGNFLKLSHARVWLHVNDMIFDHTEIDAPNSILQCDGIKYFPSIACRTVQCHRRWSVIEFRITKKTKMKKKKKKKKWVAIKSDCFDPSHLSTMVLGQPSGQAVLSFVKKSSFPFTCYQQRWGLLANAFFLEEDGA
jgi:hypothetical protein